MTSFSIVSNFLSQSTYPQLKKHTKKIAVWDKSKFPWLAFSASATKHVVGKELAVHLCKSSGFDATVVRNARQSDVSFLIEQHPACLKFAMLGEEGLYMFEQIRDRNYQILFLLGLSPQDAHIWIFHKDQCLPHLAIQRRKEKEKWIHIRPQNSEWINPSSPPEWMQKQSGKLAEFPSTLKKILAELP